MEEPSSPQLAYLAWPGYIALMNTAAFDYPRFKGDPRILIVGSDYFLVPELINTCKREGVEHHVVMLTEALENPELFIPALMDAAESFRPDFVLTINHAGVDPAGALLNELERVRIPLASWYVDNPLLALFLFENGQSEWSTVFSYDRETVAPLRQQGFPHVEYLPLATDPTFFHPGVARGEGMPISFVGDSKSELVAERLRTGQFPMELMMGFKELAQEFMETAEPELDAFMARTRPEMLGVLQGLPDVQANWFRSMIVHEACRRYRLACINAVMELGPVIAGDNGWQTMLRGEENWQHHPVVDYYTELPSFYASSRINLNATSPQMKGAANQRIFDVPACGAFLLTDHGNQLDDLFEVGTELACFDSPEELKEKALFYLNNPVEREKIVAAAQRRVLAEHTYSHRLNGIVDSMRRRYS